MTFARHNSASRIFVVALAWQASQGILVLAIGLFFLIPRASSRSAQDAIFLTLGALLTSLALLTPSVRALLGKFRRRWLFDVVVVQVIYLAMSSLATVGALAFLVLAVLNLACLVVFFGSYPLGTPAGRREPDNP